MKYEDVPGWFGPVDQAAFSWILRFQHAHPPAALVELGTYLGKSAILIANHRRAEEVLTVCDLFEAAGDSPLIDEQERAYLASQGLSQAAFERNFLAFHRDLPRIVSAPSAQITRHVAPDTARFVHVDAGHGYAQVREDLASARVMLRETGVVAINNHRKPETPGVAAAVWEAVMTGGLNPFLTTPSKIYASWGDPAPLRAMVAAQAAASEWLALKPDVAVRGDLVLHHVQRRA